MSGKKVCLNSSSSYYTGKEQSPLHYGLSAEGYDINSIMEGYDKELWVVDVRNNKKVWTKKDHINKMTYEIPLIKELADTKDTALDSAMAACADDVAIAGASTNDEDNVPMTPAAPAIAPAILAKKTRAKANTNASRIRKKDTSKDASNITGTVATEATGAAAEATGAVAETATEAATAIEATDATNVTNATKVSKVMKPTDYTLFITYRIHQMKAESGDNKNNYNCAREEWKEYKSKPDKLREIMVAATSFHKAAQSRL
jgi:hypothetical protein